jgi:ribosome modulation factor
LVENKKKLIKRKRKRKERFNRIERGLYEEGEAGRTRVICTFTHVLDETYCDRNFRSMPF